MRLTHYTDYSLRVLLYLAVYPGRLVSTEEISQAYGISNNHLVKVVNNLGHHGFLHIKRGRHGGIALSRNPSEIRLGEVVRCTEPDFYLMECFNSQGNGCTITSVCRMHTTMVKARQAFLRVLDSHTLADMIEGESTPEEYRQCFLIPPANGDGRKKDLALNS